MGGGGEGRGGKGVPLYGLCRLIIDRVWFLRSSLDMGMELLFHQLSISKSLSQIMFIVI